MSNNQSPAPVASASPFAGNHRYMLLAERYPEFGGPVAQATIFWLTEEEPTEKEISDAFDVIEGNIRFVLEKRIVRLRKRWQAAREQAEAALAQITDRRLRDAARGSIYRDADAIREEGIEAKKNLDAFLDRMDAFREMERVAAEVAAEKAAEANAA